MMQRIVNAIWPILVLWIVLLSVAIALDADWPETRRLDFALLAAIGTFNLLLASVMLRRMRGVDVLTLALAAVFVTKSLLWFFFTASRLWPEFVAEHQPVFYWVFRLLIITSLTGAFLLLVTTPDGRYEEGRQAGIAEEKAAEHEREMAAGR